MASRYRAMATRLAKFEEAGPPPDRPEEQNVTMRLAGGRTGIRAVIVEQLELTGLMEPFDAEISYGERVAVLGGNGSVPFPTTPQKAVLLRTAASYKTGTPEG